MINPFAEDASTEATDLELVSRSVGGDRAALEQLIRRHQAWIYNIAVRMVCDPIEAEDITQEVLIRVITKLGTFAGKSAFRTWLYRIVSNHVLTMKRSRLETEEITFQQLGERLHNMPDLDLPDPRTVPVDAPVLIEETKLRCTAGMLLCLDRRQRLVYTLGELFGVNHNLAAEILELSPDNFRQLLTRARRDLYNFMQRKCGLIDPANPCRCAKKTRAMIDAGAVDPHRLRFVPEHVQRIEQIAGQSSVTLDVLDARCATVQREHPFLDSPDEAVQLRTLVESDEFRRSLDLDR